jgi:hypothetical protein
MKSKIWPILAIVFGLLLVMLIPALFMFGQFGAGNFGYMMEGPRMMYGGGGFFHPLRWCVMLLACLVPAAALGFLVFGVARLVTPMTKPGVVTPPAVERQCAKCSKTAQSDWTTCPYCGEPLSE